MDPKSLLTKSGFNVLDPNVSLNDFLVNSDYAMFKVHASGTFATNILGTKTITHTLGYRPFVLVFSQFVDTDGLGSPILSTEYYQHDWLIEGASVEFFGFTKIYDDAVRIEVGNTDVIQPGAVSGIYYIFEEEVGA